MFMSRNTIQFRRIDFRGACYRYNCPHVLMKHSRMFIRNRTAIERNSPKNFSERKITTNFNRNMSQLFPNNDNWRVTDETESMAWTCLQCIFRLQTHWYTKNLCSSIFFFPFLNFMANMCESATKKYWRDLPAKIVWVSQIVFEWWENVWHVQEKRNIFTEIDEKIYFEKKLLSKSV